MIKRLLFLAACGTLWFVFGAAPASADNGPHVKGAGVVADGCAGCHRTHTAKAENLLKDAQPGLCYTCHGTSVTGAKTNVVDGMGYDDTARAGTPGALRGGGFAFALIGSNAPTGQSADSFNAGGVVPVKAAGTAVTSSHTVDGTTGTAWGNGAISGTANLGKPISLTCGSCHDPHGNGNFRILKDVPTDSGGTSAPVADSAAGVAKVYTTANYWKVDDTAAPAFIANVSAWCTTCHTRYLAPRADSGTGSGDAVFSYRHKSNGTTQGGASCIQCHVSHGSNAAMSGEASAAASNNPGSTAATGSSKLLRIDNRGTCQMCHNK